MHHACIWYILEVLTVDANHASTFGLIGWEFHFIFSFGKILLLVSNMCSSEFLFIYVCMRIVITLWYSTLEVILMNCFLSQEVAVECQNMNWGTFKPLLTDALIDHLHPIQVLTLYTVLFLKIEEKEFKVQGTFVYFQWWFLNLCNCNDDFLYFYMNRILVIDVHPSLFGISSKHLK